jgi:hypothetical protein
MSTRRVAIDRIMHPFSILALQELMRVLSVIRLFAAIGISSEHLKLKRRQSGAIR